jgi:hypothetical protein
MRQCRVHNRLPGGLASRRNAVQLGKGIGARNEPQHAPTGCLQWNRCGAFGEITSNRNRSPDKGRNRSETGAGLHKPAVGRWRGLGRLRLELADH